MTVKMQQRRGTAAQWTSANPVLADGEIGVETDTLRAKIGNGSTAWASLTYFTLENGSVGTTKLADSAVTSGKIADGAVTSDKIAADAQPGNLLTANQATGTDTLGTVTGFVAGDATILSSTDMAHTGTRCVKITATGVAPQVYVAPDGGPYTPVVAGRWYNATVMLKSDTISKRAYTIIQWRTAAGAWISDSESVAWPLSATWTERPVAAQAPPNAAFGLMYTGLENGVSGDVYYADTFGMWEGVGGSWRAPGRPVADAGAVWHIACALRNFGAPGYWAPIDDTNHTPLGVDICESYDDRIRMYFSRSATQVGSLVITGDEALAGICNVGASVDMMSADVFLKDLTTGATLNPLTTGLGASSNLWVMGVMR